ncbi:MAG: hypothetical protein ACXVZR_15005, partial [Terriglobales bacterium]
MDAILHTLTAASTNAKQGERFDALLWGATLVPLLVAFWMVAQRYNMSARIGGHMASGFASFAVLLAPYWAFGFGAAEALRRGMTNRSARVLAPGLLVVSYLMFAIPRGEFRGDYALILFSIPVGLAAMFELVPPGRGRPGYTNGLCWQDVVALVVVGAPVEFRLLAGAWAHPGLSALPKFLLVDAALYGFLVVRGLDGVGFDFRLCLRDLAIGLREWGFYAPIAIGLGLALGFIHWKPWKPDAVVIAGAYLITFFF